jgi:Flp pilus assembly protein TadD
MVKKLILLIALLLLPALSSADNYTVFRENQDSIVVVTAYNKKGEPLTEGTGFIASADGAVITNYHVIGIAKEIKVRQGSRVLNVEGVIYADKENDFVILKVKGKDLPPVKFGDAGKLNSGEKVYIISSSKDSGNTIFEGIFRRVKTISPGRKVVEITAPVSHGSSGSPLFNSHGEVIGITTFLIKRAENLILAMPADLIRDKLKMRGPITSIESIIKNYQNTAEYWFYLGYYLSEVGAHKDAIDVFKEAIRLKPGFADARYYRGVAYENLGKYKEAARDYRDAIKSKADFADAHFSLGITYGKLGMYKEAVEVLRQAVKLEPDFADAYYNLGVAYGKLGMYGEGIEAGKQAVTLKPDFADAYYNLGIAYEKSASYPEAAAAFQRVLKYRPDYAEAHYNLGIVYLFLNNKGAALGKYRELKAIDTKLAEKLFSLIKKVG